MNRKGNSANFCSYVCNGKKNKELFASTFNEITASVRCVFYNSRFKLQICPITCGAREQKKHWETKKPDKSAAFC